MFQASMVEDFRICRVSIQDWNSPFGECLGALHIVFYYQTWDIEPRQDIDDMPANTPRTDNHDMIAESMPSADRYWPLAIKGSPERGKAL